MPFPTKRIVLTGGPGAGKTTVCARLAAAYPDKIGTVPEAASEVYRQLQTRWDLLDIQGRREIQRTIYQLQLDLENQADAQYLDCSILLLDRGTVDGAAYWPDGPEAYWLDLGTTLNEELSRYDAVIWMETGASVGIYDSSESNPCRFEDPAAAIQSGEQVAAIWAAHPMFFRVAAYPTIEEKITAVEGLVLRALDSC